MIARIWHGVTRASQADQYVIYLKDTGLPDYAATEGNLGVYLLQKVDGDQAHFLTLTFWDSEESIRKFAGEEINRAKYYPEDAQFLLEMEPMVNHYQVVYP